MSEATFKIGDVVRIRSGGPRMTVYGIRPGDQGLIEAEWFDVQNVLHRDSFAGVEMCLAPPPTPGEKTTVKSPPSENVPRFWREPT